MSAFLKSTKGKITVAGIALALVIAVVVLLVVLLPKNEYRKIVVKETEGTVLVSNGKKQDTNAYSGMALFDGDKITVNADSKLVLELDGDKYMLADGGTVFTLEAKGKSGSDKTVINLESGSALTRIKNKLNDDQSYVVKTPTSTISVRGTVYHVEVSHDNEGKMLTKCNAFDGVVEVTPIDKNGTPTEEAQSVTAGSSVRVTEIKAEENEGTQSSAFVRDKDGNVTSRIVYQELPKAVIEELIDYIDDGEELDVSKLVLEQFLPHKHTFEDAWSYNYKEHWHNASCVHWELSAPLRDSVGKHTWSEETVRGATHTEEGEKKLTCIVCGYTTTETVNKLEGHTFGEWTELDERTHTRRCACGESESDEHHYGDGVEGTDLAGAKATVYTCNDCGYKKYEPIEEKDQPPVGLEGLFAVNGVAYDNWHDTALALSATNGAKKVWLLTDTYNPVSGSIKLPWGEDIPDFKVMTWDLNGHCLEKGKASPIIGEGAVWTIEATGGGFLISYGYGLNDPGYGGALDGTIIIKGGMFDFDPVDFVPSEGYTVKRLIDPDFFYRNNWEGETQDYDTILAKFDGSYIKLVNSRFGNVSDSSYEYYQFRNAGLWVVYPNTFDASSCTHDTYKKAVGNDESGYFDYCSACGAKLEHHHNYDDSEWNRDDTGHYRTCECGKPEKAEHNWGKGEVTTTATHTSEGVRTFTCSDCGATKTETINKLEGHSFGEWTELDEHKHIRRCICGETEKADHNWNNGEVTTTATHTSEGVRTFTCSDCGATKTEKIDKLEGHSFGEWTELDERTHTRRCACGESESEEHHYGESVEGTDPSGAKAMVYTCNDCGHKKYERIVETNLTYDGFLYDSPYNGGRAIYISYDQIKINGETADLASLGLHYEWRDHDTHIVVQSARDDTWGVEDGYPSPAVSGTYDFVVYRDDMNGKTDLLTVTRTIVNNEFELVDDISSLDENTLYTFISKVGNDYYAMISPLGNDQRMECEAVKVTVDENGVISIGENYEYAFRVYKSGKPNIEGHTQYFFRTGMGLYRAGTIVLWGTGGIDYYTQTNNDYTLTIARNDDGSVKVESPFCDGVLKLVYDSESGKYLFSAKEGQDTRESYPVFLYKEYYEPAPEPTERYEFIGNLTKEYDGNAVMFNIYKDVDILTVNQETINDLMKMGTCRFAFADPKGSIIEGINCIPDEDGTVTGPIEFGTYQIIFQIEVKGKDGPEWESHMLHEFMIY